MLADFQLCISVPLILEAKFGHDSLTMKELEQYKEFFS